ncbi:MAG: hypothetical protein K6A74_02880 [Lachnospiraceae bacterium]|nr:hypothetical protein [Lachnospiraceae bacterium]
MKICPNCNVNVGGNVDKCPLCQRSLKGEDTVDNWPRSDKLKAQVSLFKIQAFIVISLTIIALFLDFKFNLNPGKHYSLIIAGWALTTELLIRNFIKRSLVVPKIITTTLLFYSLLLWLTSWYYGFMAPIAHIVIPVLISATIIANFVFAIIDKYGNALVYLLSNIIIGIIPYIVLTAVHDDNMISWTVCIIISILAFLGIMFFKGHSVISEVQKRFNI